MTTYEHFPVWIPVIAIGISILSYTLGAYILIEFGISVAILYLIYCIGVELMVVVKSCKHCYYYNKVCGLGKGKITAMLTTKGNQKKFIERHVTFIDLLPDFLVTIFPIIGGTILSVLDFSLLRLGLILLILLLSFGGTAIIRGSLVCKYCKQRELGCPAQQFFNKKKTSHNRQ